MIMVIAIIYIFLSYVIFDQQLKITFRKSSVPLKKSNSPFLLTPPLKNSKRTSLPLFAKIENFSAHPTPTPLQKEGRALW